MPAHGRRSSCFLAAFSASLLLLAGCAGGGSSASSGSGGGTTTTPGLVSGGATAVYTIQAPSTGSLLVFPATSTGSVNPSVTVPISTYPQCVATDASGNIYVGSYSLANGGQVQVYAPGITAGSSPTRTITSTATNGLNTPVAMATDSSGQLYIASANNNILVFSATANGGATPVKTIAGASTGVANAQGITVDTAGSIYVANAGSAANSTILVFASSANGNVAPTRSLTIPGFAYGVAVDAALNVWVGLDTSTPSASVVEYAAGSSGSATPLKTIAGSATTLSNATIGGMRFDAAGNLWLANQIATGSTYTAYISAWPASAMGNQAPAVQFSSPSWSSPSPQFAVK